ncbi:lipase B [Apiospora saccharicola]|uniref:Lipase B n=1 Tax=Apiospora saccharicola TaxID=335842 RepID=A0ABR1TGZ8_9PEZI
MFFLLFLSFFVVVGAGPVPAPAPSPLPSPVPEPLFGFNPIAPIADGIKGELAKLASSIASTSPTATPATIPEAVSMLKAVFGPKPTGLITSGIALARNGLQTSGTQGTTINSPGAPGTINSFNNTNPAPPTPVFPKAGASDPAFDRTEKELRSAIFIPANFPGAGAANPVLLVPGTGVLRGRTLRGT